MRSSMFTWSKLYKSVPYESVVSDLSVDTAGERPVFRDAETDKQAEESLTPEGEEAGHGG